MRLPACFALVILGLTATARADRVDYGYDTHKVDTDEFWKDVAEPHADEVSMVLSKVTQALDLVSSMSSQDSDPDGSQRQRLLDDARGMAKYLRRLAPDNPEVLLALGRAADDSGRADEALEAYKQYFEVSPENAENADATLRVGRIYLRLRDYDEALRYLKISNANAYYMNGAIYLASALSETGRDEEALDVLEDAVERPGQYGGDPQLPLFALAVAYDRDEQITRAFEALDRLQQSLQGGYIGTMQSQIDSFQAVPPAETHYWRALLYESGGFLDEARSSWVLYAESGKDARFRDRALAHVKAIDVLIERMIAARKPGKNNAAAALLGSYGAVGGYGSTGYGYGGYGGYGSTYGYPPPQPAPATVTKKKKHHRKHKAKTP